eukprot:TRINITY_DN872_c0_g1_i11.p2 TRINITY_DN872_c0_g1~~TRINITY_DN872_c0_g1_i11.p2  ORF type:complete len:191 (-),score=69.72 TRINITY_DN872_c0_g1_i11:2-574(-)
MKAKVTNEYKYGMLEYLEDIIGTNKYLKEIEKLAKQVDETNEERTEKLNRAKVAEKEREDLEGAKMEAEEYLRKESLIVDKETIILKMNKKQINMKIEKMDKQRKEFESKMNEYREKNGKLINQLENEQKEYNRKTIELQKLEQQLNKSKNEFQIYERKNITLTEELKHCKSKHKKLGQTIDNEKMKNEK